MMSNIIKPNRGKIYANGNGVEFSYSLQKCKHNHTYDSICKDLLIYLPGHGHGPLDARKLVETLKKSWPADYILALDIDPPLGGDPEKAKALLPIIYECLKNKSIEAVDELSITLFGWSHGGSEALQAAQRYPEKVTSVFAVCPAGLINYSAPILFLKFLWESALIEFRRIKSGNFDSAVSMFILGSKIACHVFVDALRNLSRNSSINRVMDDIRWAGIKVVGANYTFTGNVIIILGENDTIFRWNKVFSKWHTKEDIDKYSSEYKVENLPLTRLFKILLLPGDHGSPETEADLYVESALNTITWET
jgi:pimeloyl-ACP methyl ester carboxylesterase